VTDVISSCGGEDFIMLLVIGQTSGSLQKKKVKKTIKKFMFWNASQLINMNHNKYLSSCKSLGRKSC
jgi:hypothetical protein